MKSDGGIWFAAIWVSLALGYGTWVLVWPEKYRRSWKNYLKKGDAFERWFPGRTDWLNSVYGFSGTNPNRKARLHGLMFVIVGLLFGLLIWRVEKYGPF
jgi:hypothetical protein